MDARTWNPTEPLAILPAAIRCVATCQRTPLAMARRHRAGDRPRAQRRGGHPMARRGMPRRRSGIPFKDGIHPARPMDSTSTNSGMPRHLPTPARTKLALLTRLLPSTPMARHAKNLRPRLARIRLPPRASHCLELHARKLRARLDYRLRLVWPARLGGLPPGDLPHSKA